MNAGQVSCTQNHSGTGRCLTCGWAVRTAATAWALTRDIAAARSGMTRWQSCGDDTAVRHFLMDWAPGGLSSTSRSPVLGATAWSTRVMPSCHSCSAAGPVAPLMARSTCFQKLDTMVNAGWVDATREIASVRKSAQS